MSTFTAHIVGVLDLKAAQNQMTAFLKDREVNIKANMTDSAGKSIDSQMQTINNAMKTSGAKAGASYSKSFSSSIKSPKITKAIDSVTKQQIDAQNKATKQVSQNAEQVAKQNARQAAQTAKQVAKTAKQTAKQTAQATKATNNAAFQQQWAQLQANAKANNAYHDSVVKQGKQQIQQLKVQQQKAQKIQEYYDTGYGDLQVAKLEAKGSRYQGNISKSSYQDAQKNLETVRSNNAKLSAGGLTASEQVKLFNESAVAAEKYTVQMDTLNTQQSLFVKNSSRINKANSLDRYIADNTKMGKENAQVLSSFSDELKNTNVTKGRMEEINSQIAQMKGNLTATGKTGKSFFSEIGRGFQKIGQFAITYGAIQKGIQGVQQMAKEVMNVDSAMIELRKVSDASNTDISNYLGTATESAKTYGASIDDVVNSTADYSRLGFTLDQASMMSDATTLLQKVGDNMTQETASEGLISTIKGFQLDPKEINGIVSAANEVANTQPIDTQGIFAALQRSASALNVAGNSYQESMALAAAGENNCLRNMETYYYRTHLTARAA